jgi:hypothetical protein
MGSETLRALYTVTIAADPVRRRRPIGSLQNEEFSQTPLRTAGSANSRITAATPPIRRAIGFLKIRHDTEFAESSAASPGGLVKWDVRQPCDVNTVVAADSSLRCK